MKKQILIALIGAALAAPFAVQAEGVYVGGSIGKSRTSFNTSDYSAELPEFVAESTTRSKTSYKAFVGFDINNTWAVEGGYARLGKPSYNYTGIGAAAGFNGAATVKQSALFVFGKGTLPLSEQFSVFGKLGFSRNKTKLTGNSNDADFNADFGFPASVSKNKTRVAYGVGASYTLNKQVGFRVEYEDFGKFGSNEDTGRTKVKLLSLGVTYKF
jgi:OOP family OmpA-OmpF porin